MQGGSSSRKQKKQHSFVLLFFLYNLMNDVSGDDTSHRMSLRTFQKDDAKMGVDSGSGQGQKSGFGRGVFGEIFLK